MAKANKKKKAAEKSALENPEVIAEQISKTEEFFKQHKNLVTGVFIVIVLVVGGIIGWRYLSQSKNEQAQSEMFQAVYYFEQDSLELSLRGDGNNLGFVDIAEKYGSTTAGNMANFYSGVVYLKQRKLDLALLYLQDFSSNDLLIQARAYSLIGDVYMEQDPANFEKASEFYQKASNYKPNKEFTPIYLKKAAVAFEKLDDLESAKSAYKRIIDEFWESSEYQDARKHFARLGGDES